MATHQHGNYPPVSITNTVCVYPKPSRPHKLLPLSNLDRQCPMLMYLVFFYKPSHSHTQYPSLGSVFNCLKSGLEETFSAWYPAAGRLRANPSDGKLDLWCNNGGAILVEAVTQVKISELGDLSQYNEFFEGLVFKPVCSDNFSEMPLLVAQVTRFGCGGYSVGVGTSHSLFDGPASFNFLSAWAANTPMSGNIRGHEQQHKPVHERGTLLLGHFQTQKGKGIARTLQNSNPMMMVAAIAHLYQLIKQAAMDLDGKFAKRTQLISEAGCPNQENFALKTLHLSAAMIENFRRKISSASRTGISCSSFEVVAAHLWKARTKALGLKNERLVCLQFAVDTRNKLVPPLPKNFSGNAYVLASVALTAAELEEESHEAIVEKIREAKNSISNNYVQAYINALESSQATLPPLKELTIVSDWTRMPFHRVKFLNQEAAYASPLVPPLPQVAYFMQSPTESGGIDMRIGLHPQIFNAFCHYFLTNFQ
ncbi:brassinosteroid-related acyltransferase 1 [Malania oleifera]|uniref:brassinosteroid-related acyltransferase 1 n=1 Tax=Malania oleifera TaxID=397392 RepID=UPI0025AEB0D8|nr:brassinosteroid-related acyltransferase 1 [Malania oleifera]